MKRNKILSVFLIIQPLDTIYPGHLEKMQSKKYNLCFWRTNFWLIKKEFSSLAKIDPHNKH